MNKLFCFFCCLLVSIAANTQNVGIGTTTPVQKLHVAGQTYLNGNVGIGHSSPAFPLTFGTSLGDKISLWSNSANSYGFGIQSGELQIHTDIASSSIVFGYGSSSELTERVKIFNQGSNAMSLRGRIQILNGSSPIDINQTPGIWLYRPDNSMPLAFIGTQDQQNVGIYGGPAGWGFIYDAVNSRVGIGNNNPSYQLDLSNRMRIRSGGSNAVSAGMWLNNNANSEAAFIGMEDDTHVGFFGNSGAGWKFGMNTVTGALRINGSEGQSGQVLQSNGTSGASWVSPTNSQYNSLATTGVAFLFNISQAMPLTLIPGMSYTFNVTGNAKILVTFGLHVQTNSCSFPKKPPRRKYSMQLKNCTKEVHL